LMSRTKLKVDGEETATNISTIEVTGKLVVNHRARAWCTLPYPDHPRGCPNYGRTDNCPPRAPHIEDWLDFSRPHWFIMARFDLARFAARMKSIHPTWSDRQCRCCLYWQNSVRSRLSSSCKDLQKSNNGAAFTLRPEAMGIDVISTALALGIAIELKPRATVHAIALLGYPRQS